MGVGISYMGTKKHLAPAVCDVIRSARPGILLDAFAGMCSVGEHVAPARQVWSNDVQVFASEIARAIFTSKDEPLDAVRAADIHFDAYQSYRLVLAGSYRAALAKEQSVLSASSFEAFSERRTRLSAAWRRESGADNRHYGNLFAKTYSDTYFGVQQAVEADSIVRAIRRARRDGIISDDHRRWLTISLGRALLKIATSTGHFAQFLTPNRSTYKRYISQRRRSLWNEWLLSMGELEAAGTAEWRQQNKCFNKDALVLLPKFRTTRERPSVIYADPPYTADQYSRYYHIFETLCLYDYPTASGAGRYRDYRFSSSFSLKSKSPDAFEDLVKAASQSGADLVLSYPTNGLLYQTGTSPEVLLRKHYCKVECCYSLPHTHSTFGASKGKARSDVTERIYLAKS